MKKLNLIFILLVASTASLTILSCASGYARMVINEADKNDDNLMTYKEYFSLVSNDSEYVIQAKGRDKTVKKYSREEFDKMDKNKDGFVDKQELKEFTFK